MINFFRKIRKKLADDNKPLKYMRYAIGEIFLVVIGILIALSINNWNENRKNRIEEAKMLYSFREVLQNDLSSIEFSMSFTQSVQESITFVQSSLEDQLQYHDSLSYHFWNTTAIWPLPITESIFETLKSKGTDMITNEKLRNELITFYDTDNRSFQRAQILYFDFLDHASKNIYNSRFDGFWTSNYDEISKQGEWNEQYITEHMVGRMTPLDFHELKSDTEFKYFLKTLYNRYAAHIQMPTDKMHFKITELIEMIEQELSEPK
jgi:hypothetical protein